MGGLDTTLKLYILVCICFKRLNSCNKLDDYLCISMINVLEICALKKLPRSVILLMIHKINS